MQPPPPAPPAGYYLVVRSALLPAAKGEKPRRGSDAKTPYSLSVSLESGPADLELEPNDEPARANDASAGRSGYLSPAGDQDWYRVKVEKESLLRVEVSALERADVELAVYLPAARPGDKPTLLARANEGGPREGEVLPSVGVPAGEALVLVQGAARNFDGKWTRDGEDRETLYKLGVSLAPDDCTHDKEPNDDLDHAQAIALPPGGVTLTGTLWPKRDQDLYRFHVEEGRAPLGFRLSAIRGVDAMLQLSEVKPGGKGRLVTVGTADMSRGEGEEAILAVPLKAGDYVIAVSSPRGKDASATQPYTLTVR